MRFVTLFTITLLSLASLTWAQTEPIQPTDNLITETTSTATNSRIALTAQADWRILLPDAAESKKELNARPAILSIKPEPISLTALTQGRSDSLVGLEFSIGGFRPGGQLRDTELISSTVGLGFNAGFRLRATPIQLDAGVDLIIDGIGSPRTQDLFPGYPADIDDVETMLYFGPRVYLTPRSSKVQFSLGGGGTFAYYKEFLETGDTGDFNFRCFSCEGRSGWGFYGLGQLRYQINPVFGVGVTAKYYRVTTEGEAFSNTLPRRTTDDWLGLMLTFSFR